MKRSSIVAALAIAGVLVAVLALVAYPATQTDTSIPETPATSRDTEPTSIETPARSTLETPAAVEDNDVAVVNSDQAESVTPEEPSTKSPDETRRFILPRVFGTRSEKSRVEYELFLQQLLGDVPGNPIAALSNLDESKLVKLLHGEYDEFGEYLAALESLRDSLAFFEDAGPSAGLDGQVRARILHVVVRHHAERIREQPDTARRILALLDGHLAAWQGQPTDLVAGMDLIWSFHEICPTVGGLDLIRKWTVENPHGHSTIEAMLAQALQFWPLNECQFLVLEVLGTRRTGAINGIIDAWDFPRATKWPPSEFKSSIVPAIVDALKETKSTWALITALVAKDVAEPHFVSIAEALFVRRDSAACSAYGFSFLNGAGMQAAAQVKWKEWLWSGDAYKAEAACRAVEISGMKPASEAVDAIDQMLSLALGETEPATLRAAAAIALSVRDRETRASKVLEAWTAESAIEAIRLSALGRILKRAPAAQCESMLAAKINDSLSTPALRHLPLFLLAVRNPERALEFCELDLQRAERWFTSESLLLAAAAAAGVQPDTAERAAKVRLQIAHPEPNWMREIRLRLDPPDRGPEARVVGLFRR